MTIPCIIQLLNHLGFDPFYYQDGIYPDFGVWDLGFVGILDLGIWDLPQVCLKTTSSPTFSTASLPRISALLSGTCPAGKLKQTG